MTSNAMMTLATKLAVSTGMPMKSEVKIEYIKKSVWLIAFFGSRGGGDGDGGDGNGDQLGRINDGI